MFLFDDATMKYSPQEAEVNFVSTDAVDPTDFIRCNFDIKEDRYKFI